MKLYFFAFALLLLPAYANAQAQPKANITRFNIQEKLTPERMEYFINNPPNSDEYNMLQEEHYGMEEIACYAAEYHPEKVDDIFSSYNYRWIPRCNAWSLLTKVPKFKTLNDKYIQLSGVYNICGTITQDIGASMTSYFIKAGVMPEFGKNNFSEQQSGYDLFLSDMERWALAGIWEKEQYEELQNLKRDTVPAIASYYKMQFKISQGDAEKDAADLLKAIDMLYLQRYSSCTYTKIPNNQEIDQFLAGGNFLSFNEKLDKECPYNRPIMSNDEWVAAMLQTAIVQHRPIDDIKKLIAYLSKEITPSLLREPIHQSAPHYPEALALLIKASPQTINEGNAFGKTVLMYAAQYNNIESTKLLLASKVNLNAQTTSPASQDKYISCDQNFRLQTSARTPLMYAAWYSTSDLVKLLLDAGAEKNALDSNKKTACDYLEQNSMIDADQWAELKDKLCSH